MGVDWCCVLQFDGGHESGRSSLMDDKVLPLAFWPLRDRYLLLAQAANRRFMKLTGLPSLEGPAARFTLINRLRCDGPIAFTASLPDEIESRYGAFAGRAVRRFYTFSRRAL